MNLVICSFDCPYFKEYPFMVIPRGVTKPLSKMPKCMNHDICENALRKYGEIISKQFRQKEAK